MELGDNRAAQVHAENLAEACAGGHWGLDGTKHAMRYTLAGGYQVNGENVWGLDFCEDSDLHVMSQVQHMMESVVYSEGHLAVIQESVYQRVNVGLAFNNNGYLVAVQQFEGNYVVYEIPPRIEGGLLQMEGRLKNGAELAELDELDVQVWYDSPTESAALGQLAQVSCVGPGRQVVAIRPLPVGRNSVKWKPFVQPHRFCPRPHDFPADTPAPTSKEEALIIREEAQARADKRESVDILVPWIPASVWHAEGQQFAVTADLSDVLEKHGPGVYKVVLWAPVNGQTVVVSEYSIFHEVEIPEGYGPP